jgi:hypothetical protein
MRHIPEAGAVCGNPARTDLRGGQGVTSVPTATGFDSDLSPPIAQPIKTSPQAGRACGKLEPFHDIHFQHPFAPPTTANCWALLIF